MCDLFVANIMIYRFVFVVIIFVEFDFPCELVVFCVFCLLEELTDELIYQIETNNMQWTTNGNIDLSTETERLGGGSVIGKILIYCCCCCWGLRDNGKKRRR